ncbi:hypothetical protein cand_018850 [Cryptosporidium andersoni]|uniref:RNA polymerase II transcription factor B subunit 4 n=1 Tax=Cryptosporidium andersoni TaxID=117008 RepID=A0A1J4MA00_9CRYT|nr:hypothetical protein cand_018850 [Cryptosporidium andersoni]
MVVEDTLFIIIDIRSLIGIYYNDDQIKGNNSLSLSGRSVWDSIISFIRLYGLSSSQRKRTCIYICSSSDIIILYNGFISDLTNNIISNILPKLSNICYNYQNISEDDIQLASGISICLCKINSDRKLYSKNRTNKDRILLFDASNEKSYINQYVLLINSSHAALKLDVIIDVCSISNNPSRLLYNVVDISKGIYINYSSIIKNVSSKIDDKSHIQDGLLPFIIFHLLPSAELRANSLINLSTKSRHSGISVCFCHYKKVEVGFICSSCLAIFCSLFRAPICAACSARFKRVPIQQKSLSYLNIEDGDGIF